jgi:hypothetical protein
MNYKLFTKSQELKKKYKPIFWFIGILVLSNVIVSFFPYLRFLKDLLFYSTLLSSLIYFTFFMIVKFKETYLILNRIIAVIIIIFVLFWGIILTVTEIAPLAPDIPNWLNSEYYCIQGYAVNINKKFYGKSTYQKFTINGINFEVSPASSFEELHYNKYRVSYLPHSKYVISIEKVGN